jgi:hypothetical protein
MLKKTLIAAATAGLIGLGMVGTTTSASAAGAQAQFGGPGWSVTIGSGNYNPYNQYKPGKFCTPIVKKVKWWDRFGYPHWSQVVVGQKCPPPKFPPFPPHGPFPHNPGPFPGGPFPGGPYHPGPHW